MIRVALEAWDAIWPPLASLLLLALVLGVPVAIAVAADRRDADEDTWRTFAERREALRRAVEAHPAGRGRG